MKFKIEIKCDNDAFHAEDCHCDVGSTHNCAETTAHEVRRLVRDIEQKLDDGYRAGYLYDANGNSVGTWGFDAS